MVQLCLNRHLDMRNGPSHLNIRMERVFHTTSEASQSGPPSTYLNVVTVYVFSIHVYYKYTVYFLLSPIVASAAAWQSSDEF